MKRELLRLRFISLSGPEQAVSLGNFIAAGYDGARNQFRQFNSSTGETPCLPEGCSVVSPWPC